MKKLKGSDRFERIMARFRKMTMLRYIYARKTVPANALAVVLELGRRWWWITPALAGDAGAWRLSYGDERGPSGHVSTDYQNRPFWTKYDAIMEVFYMQKRARITEYITPTNEHVRVAAARANPGRPSWRGRGRRR